MANLFATGIWGLTQGQSLAAMRDAFETEKPQAAWERDCNTMAAAQWILWHGQNLFKLIIYDNLEEKADDRGNWWFGKELAGSSMKPRSVERWGFWKTGFEAVESDPDASDECKKLASRVAELMASIEQSLLF